MLLKALNRGEGRLTLGVLDDCHENHRRMWGARGESGQAVDGRRFSRPCHKKCIPGPDVCPWVMVHIGLESRHRLVRILAEYRADVHFPMPWRKEWAPA